jgi:hypothetical protein
MKKRLQLKKVTLRNLDDKSLGGVQGGNTDHTQCTPACNGISDDTACTSSWTNCETTGCDTCACPTEGGCWTEFSSTCQWGGGCFTWEPTCC